jgi:hypothetical protein
MTCDISKDATVHIATGTRDQLVQVWKYDSKGLQAVFSVQLNVTVAKSIGFADNAAKDICLWAFQRSTVCS